MFQGEVSVVIDTGISDEVDSRLNPFAQEDELISHSNKKRSKPELSRFEKAMKIAKKKMNSNQPKGRYKKSEKKKLLDRAMGGKLGAGKVGAAFRKSKRGS